MGKKKGLLLVIMLCAAVCSSVLLFMVMTRINDSETKNMITRFEVAKMVTALFDDTDNLEESSNDKEWYDKYIKYLTGIDLMNGSGSSEGFSYEDLTYMLTAMDISLDDIPNNESIVRRKRSKLSHEQWYVIYDYLIDYYNASEIICIDLTVIGTPSNISGMDEWTVLTDKGYYGFEGLALDSCIDSVIRVLVRGDEILSNISTVSTDVTYRNVWITESRDSVINVYMNGINRSFLVEGMTETIKGSMADIIISGQQVSQLNLKKDTIRGRVLSINESTVEIEGYGKVEFDSEYRVYKLYGGFSEAAYTDVLVGYDMQEFIVADGKVCGITISYPLNVENIRVLIKNNNFEGIYHENLTLSSEGGLRIMNISDDVVIMEVAPNEKLELTKDNQLFTDGRIRIEPAGESGICINSLQRSSGNPVYPGNIEVDFDDNGLFIINDVNLEEYIKLVVPAEMPVSYGVEALKVQAVCARSYAYIQLLRNSYREYGAHIDDSTSYQVYNNMGRSETADKAVDETCGKVIKYNGEVIEAFYYSTSCGYGTDVTIWNEYGDDYGYIVSQPISSDGEELDLTSNKDFYLYIANRRYNDYDRLFPYYRWYTYLSIEEINEYYAEAADVGEIKSITIDKRNAGGSVHALTIHGAIGDYTVVGEYEIRKFLGRYDIYWRNDIESLFQMSILPSAFIALKENSYNGEVKGYDILGGGYGHGVGMSQNAAYRMTQRGMDYERIIKFFYHDVSIENLY